MNKFKTSFYKKIQDENESLKKENSDLIIMNNMYKKYFPESNYDKDLNYTANNATTPYDPNNIEEQVARLNIKYADIINSDSIQQVEVIKEINEVSDDSEQDSDF